MNYAFRQLLNIRATRWSSTVTSGGASNGNTPSFIRLTGTLRNSSLKVPVSEFAVSLSPRAIERIREINRKFGTGDSLRVKIDSGGCHGFQYGFELTSKPQEDDIIFKSAVNDGREEPVVLIDAISYPYLAGSEIDFTEELIGSAFKIASNPNASSECGCKISFQAK